MIHNVIASNVAPYAMTAGSVLLLAQAADPLSGGAGWLGAGLLGAVLAWLCLVHLPAKDKQLREIMDVQANERSVFQTTLLQLQSQNLEESRRNREKFVETSHELREAIEMQTVKLEQAIAGTCKHDRHPMNGVTG
jgi:hypothetical protein